MNVFIGMETSGKTLNAFRAKGHNAWSCDLLPSDVNSNYHIQDDVYTVLNSRLYNWDIIIMHPTCAKLCVSGNHVYAKGKPKYQERLDAVEYTEQLWLFCKKLCDKVCFENPVGVLSTMSCLPKPQYIQPYQFGHDASKKTGLILYGLPKLKPTNRIRGRIVERNGNRYERWANQTDSGQNKLGPSKDRWKLRSETYQGVSDAMAEQWG